MHQWDTYSLGAGQVPRCPLSPFLSTSSHSPGKKPSFRVQLFLVYHRDSDPQSNVGLHPSQHGELTT